MDTDARADGSAGHVEVPRPSRALPAAVAAALGASALALTLAPTRMPDSYHWIAHTTSESAAQGLDGAWVARLGFLLFGFAVLALAALARERWGPLASGLHAAFGVLMVATAAFSARSWEQGAAYDPVENALHSFAATALGFAFAFGVAAAAWTLLAAARRLRWIDVIAVSASVVLPLGMMMWPQLAGVLQRTMFVVAYAWYLHEAWSTTPPSR